MKKIFFLIIINFCFINLTFTQIDNLISSLNTFNSANIYITYLLINTLIDSYSENLYSTNYILSINNDIKRICVISRSNIEKLIENNISLGNNNEYEKNLINIYNLLILEIETFNEYIINPNNIVLNTLYKYKNKALEKIEEFIIKKGE